MVRRNYKITSEQDEMIARLSREMEIDKEQVVQLALEYGLATAEELWKSAGKPIGLHAYAKGLLELKEKSIKNKTVKRRS